MRQLGPVLLEPERWPVGIIALAAVIVLWLVLRALVSREQRRRLIAPLVLIAIYLALSFGIDELPSKFRALRYLEMLAALLLLLALGRVLSLLLIDWLLGRRFKRQMPKIVRDIIEGLLVVVALFMTLHVGGVDPNSLLATSALLTAIIGLSLQDTLGNLFAGLSLQAQHTFGVGDWIQLDRDGQQLGRVIEINWRATRVRTRDCAELTIPNGQLARSVIFNLSRSLPAIRRAVVITVPYEFPATNVQRLIMRSIALLPDVPNEPAASVTTQGFSDFGVQYAVRYFVKDFDRAEQLDGLVRDRARAALARAGIPLATPLPQPVAPNDAEAAGDTAAREARTRAISGFAVFRGLPERAVAALAGAARNERYEPGEIVVKEGEAGEDLYLCLSGELAVLRSGRDGSSEENARIPAGSLFGERSVLTGQPRVATVQALGACELLRIEKAALFPVLAQNPELAELLADCLAEHQAALETSGRMSTEERRSSIESYKGQLLRRVREFFLV